MARESHYLAKQKYQSKDVTHICPEVLYGTLGYMFESAHN